MQVAWHCRGCNEQGAAVVNLGDLIEKYPNRMDLLSCVMTEIELVHKCDNVQLGIRAKDSQTKENNG